MSGYDANKDKIIKEEIIGNGEYKVQVCSYDGGKEKISIVKEMYFKGERTYTSKVGRLDFKTAQEIAETILEMVDE